MNEIDVSNDQLVSVWGDFIVVMQPKEHMTKTEALRQAAWLVAVANEDDKFSAILDAVRNT